MDLRSRIIRLAHAKPELRPQLLPVLKEAALPPYKLIVDMIKRLPPPNVGNNMDLGLVQRLLEQSPDSDQAGNLESLIRQLNKLHIGYEKEKDRMRTLYLVPITKAQTELREVMAKIIASIPD